MRFQWGFNYICFFQYSFYCQDSNAIQTDTECIKIFYPLVLPVCTDRICTSTIKLTQMNLILFWKQVNNAGVVPLLLIIPFFFFFFFFFFLRWKAKSFREIFKNTWRSATLINGKLCYKVSEVKATSQHQIQNGPISLVENLKTEQFHKPLKLQKIVFLS